MSNPPANIPPAELWSALIAMPRPHRVVDFPRKNPETGEFIGQVALVPLTQGEAVAAAAQAEKFTRSVLKEALDENVRRDETSSGYDDIYNNSSVDEVLFRATRIADSLTSPFFTSPAVIRQKLTQDEVAALFRQYLIVKAELGPIVAEMSEGEMKAWVARLVEGGSHYPLALLSSDGLNALVMLMASHLQRFWTATSSPGWQPPRSPPEKDPTESESPPSEPTSPPAESPETTSSSPAGTSPLEDEAAAPALAPEPEST